MSVRILPVLGLAAAGAVLGGAAGYGVALIVLAWLARPAMWVGALLGAGVMAAVAVSQRPDPRVYNRQDPPRAPGPDDLPR